MGSGTSGVEGLDHSYLAAYRVESRMPIVGDVNEFELIVDEATVLLKEKVKAGLEKVRNLLSRKER